MLSLKNIIFYKKCLTIGHYVKQFLIFYVYYVEFCDTMSDYFTQLLSKSKQGIITQKNEYALKHTHFAR